MVAPAAALRGGQEHSLNVRGACPNMAGAYLKVLWGSIAIITAAIVITFTGYIRADSIGLDPDLGDDHPAGPGRNRADLLEAARRSCPSSRLTQTQAPRCDRQRPP
jgi:hypothetical protein